MKKMLSTLFLMGIVTLAFAQTIPHSNVIPLAKQGPDGTPISVPWPKIEKMIREGDTRLWDTYMNPTMNEFVETAASYWRIAATREAVANIIREFKTVPYQAAIHGPKIAHNSGVDKMTGKIVPLENRIEEGTPISIHDDLGPVGKDDCNNLLRPIFLY